MNDERFFDLAMRVIAGQATGEESAELAALAACDPQRREEYARLAAGARAAKDALPLVDAMQANKGDLPSYARGRLQKKVRQTLGRRAAVKAPDRSLARGWRWALGLAAAAAMVVLVVVPMVRAPSTPMIQLAMLDLTDATRGSETNEVALLRETWPAATLETFTSVETLREWQVKDESDAVKIF